ncbi:MAG TPA: hypothetical protein VGI72_08620, partial [Gaiellales bacterium]
TRSDGPHPQIALAGFAARTARAGTSRVAMYMRMSGLPGAGTIEVDATGVVAFRSGAGAMRMRMISPTTGSVLHIREITRWPVVYMRSSLFASEPHSRGPWVKLDLARIESRHGLNVNALANTGGNDPAEMLSTLAGESDSITIAGRHAMVRGVETTHYRAVIDLSKVAASAPPSLRAAARRSETRLEAMLGKHLMPVDVWIGADGLVRRVAYRTSVSAPGAAVTLTTSVRLEMFGFGVPVHVTAPPASQTTDLTAAVAAGSGSG